MCVPTVAAGLLIGKGGETIKGLSAISNAKISLIGRDQVHPSVDERIVLIKGTLSQQLDGARLVLEQMNSATSVNAFGYSNPSTNYGSVGAAGPGMMGAMGYGARGARPSSAAASAAAIAAGGKSFTVQVPDALVGKLVGKGGATLRELEAASGAKISVSKKGEFLAGTENR